MSDQPKPKEITPLPRASNAPQRKVFVNGLVIDAFIGAYESEQGAPQPVVIDFEADVIEPSNPVSDRLEDVVCYDRLTQGIREIIAEGHIKLVETLAERIADLVLSHPMVLGVTVKVIKPNAIKDANAVGVTIQRMKR